MIFKKNIVSNSLFIFLCLIMVHCNSKKEIVEKKNTQGENPRFTSLKLTEDLSIVRESWYPSGIEIDKEGNIFIVEVDFAQIYI